MARSLLSGALAMQGQLLTPAQHGSLAAGLQGQMILAPLTRGGSLPFRRLCADFGCTVSMGEMVFARTLLSDDPKEKARLRRAPNEGLFGVQIATNNVEEGARAIERAAAAGADWVDLNCGCPIYEATRRGLGSALLRRPARLAGLVRSLVERSPIPISVKVRENSPPPGPLRSCQVDENSHLPVHSRSCARCARRARARRSTCARS